MRSFAPIPDPSTTIHGVQRGPALLPLQLGADATLERGTALENQVAVLEQGFMELQVKFEELLSCVRAESQPGREEVADASSVGTAHEGEEATAVEVDWEKTPEHTIAHSSSFRPINCICALPFTLKDDLIMAREVEMLDGI